MALYGIPWSRTCIGPFALAWGGSGVAVDVGDASGGTTGVGESGLPLIGDTGGVGRYCV